MPSNKKSPPSVTQNVSGDNNVVVGGDVTGNVVVGDNNTVNQTIIQKIFNIFKTDAETVDQRNRRIMLGHVENFWVKGILEKSLHGAALLDLGIKEDPDALTYPWAIKREANKETLPAGTSMLEVFQEIGMGRSLLILGAPGSGKTTMLLELTRQLIERAREDVTEPIPVVFNLSSWTDKLSLADWLARELNNIYTIPKKVAPTWVKENKMLLLLDGLDEVRQESRDKCVDAINQFRKENGLTSMAICSRIQDYVELKTRLSFDGAIEIQPLTSNQVDDYFKRFGKGLAGIRQVLKKDTALREMAETPLFLSIMTLAYQGKSAQNFSSENLETIEARRKHLFNAYVEQMFERIARTKNNRYTPEKTERWLSWLAQKMSAQGRSIFLLDRIKRDWLQTPTQQKLYIASLEIVLGLVFGLSLGLLVVVAADKQFPGLVLTKQNAVLLVLFFGVLFGLGVRSGVGFLDLGWSERRLKKTSEAGKWSWKKGLSGLLAGLGVGRDAGLVFGLVGGLLLGLKSGLIIGLFSGTCIGLGTALSFGLLGGHSNSLDYDDGSKSTGLWSWVWTKTGFGLLMGTVSGLAVGLSTGLIVLRFLDTASALLLGLFVGFIFGLGSGLGGGLLNAVRDVDGLEKSTQLLKWSWKKAWPGLVIGLASGLGIGLFFGLLLRSPSLGLTLGLFFSLVFGLVSGIVSGLESAELEETTTPNQGIRRSLKNSSIGMGSGLFIGLVAGMVLEVNLTASSGLFLGLVVGPIVGLFLGLVLGGYVVLNHYILRFLLYGTGYMPWNYVRFLDYCTDLIFLRRVGGGYIFVHRLLMEHFAAMYPEET
jgi:hypothetical protein